MTGDLKRAADILRSEGCTCVLVREDTVIRSFDRGVKPLMELLEQGRELSRFSAADKVVGKATAFLYVRLGVARVWAGVMSRGAAEVLARFGVEYCCDVTAEHIFNRKKTGFCPMETAVQGIDELDTALGAIGAKYKQLNR